MRRIDPPLSPGPHSIQTRATEATQTDQPTPPIPDGATGWPSISFTVA